MNSFKKIVLAGLCVVGIASGSATACDLNSGGFLAKLGECIFPGATLIFKQLDQWHGQAGRPLDHAFAGAVNGFVPGAGTAMGIQLESKSRWRVQWHASADVHGTSPHL
jgi:hypothetical protein